jgi:hypothetical protein
MSEILWSLRRVVVVVQHFVAEKKFQIVLCSVFYDGYSGDDDDDDRRSIRSRNEMNKQEGERLKKKELRCR